MMFRTIRAVLPERRLRHLRMLAHGICPRSRATCRAVAREGARAARAAPEACGVIDRRRLRNAFMCP
jgi:hypothetical protein